MFIQFVFSIPAWLICTQPPRLLPRPTRQHCHYSLRRHLRRRLLHFPCVQQAKTRLQSRPQLLDMGPPRENHRRQNCFSLGFGATPATSSTSVTSSSASPSACQRSTAAVVPPALCIPLTSWWCCCTTTGASTPSARPSTRSRGRSTRLQFPAASCPACIRRRFMLHDGLIVHPRVIAIP
jgi:hypothetical protein